MHTLILVYGENSIYFLYLFISSSSSYREIYSYVSLANWAIVNNSQ